MNEITLDNVYQDIEKSENSLIRLCQDLIRFPTVNPPGNDYQAIVEYIGNRLKGSGFSVEYIRAYGAPGDCPDYPRFNVVARYETGKKGPCVHFNSHIDVVETGDGWTKDPFAAELIDGKVYGRGACDMKGGLAASIIAAEALINSGIELKGAIEISGTADEESGGLGGVAFLAEKGYFAKDRVDHVIIPEPLNVDRVCLGHRGVWWAEIETHGRIAHGSMPFLGDCAIRHMGAVVAEFEDKLYPAMAARHTAMPVVPEGAKQSTLNINSIHGGQEEGAEGLPSPCVPDSCRMIIDRRFLVEEDLGQVKGEVTDILDNLETSREGFKYEIRDMLEVIPSMTDIDAPVVQATAKAIEDVLGKKADFVCSPGTYDQKHIDRIGNLKDCIAYGPGILELAHQPDEYVEVADMVNSAKVMAKAAYDLLNK
ncbi:acetylornithine deacetylase/succinyl-diaminopimelate desuccinylase family protein [Pseudemcibacter aquimaris]|uniref:acetylornithine deacetylase/succinyl-diaminopimelate desuccinylase family protein n=1 Tax=Pseudemcibacter aquimaris TaxID=2857064 RepID=UPI002012E869|nr:acetylornithine deacetylase/succinyl-diaminopimelate desuccinylase family protein [Pseudemcibacter aquimaris]MCC3859707.1 acetylornithine deacetylase/succinyl-diaminopimelate desuccinylase family protein [Pseudemcibacter aquimaris]WDU60102.1 acetylornithine deacetylase/succinyl-diaminopimelate desuccinylase family protein [Pseudemcibacter aquimaris]